MTHQQARARHLLRLGQAEHVEQGGGDVGEDAVPHLIVRGVFGNAVKTGSTETVGSVNTMVNLGGLTGARTEEAASFEVEHPEWAATVKAYVDWARGRTPARR